MLLFFNKKIPPRKELFRTYSSKTGWSLFPPLAKGGQGGFVQTISKGMLFMSILGIVSPHTTLRENQGQMYGRIFKPFTVGGFVIIPEGELPPSGSGIPLVMGKKGAFGSGEHETTASCLEELERLPGIAGMRCLDLGSGTGILAIAAVKLGAGKVVAIDIAPAAAASCAANVRLNGMEEQVVPVCGELGCLREGDFDLIMANIYADIHLALAGEMVARTRPGGFLLLSGIPVQDNFDVQLRFRREGCELIDSRFMEEYVTFLFRKSSSPGLDPALVMP